MAVDRAAMLPLFVEAMMHRLSLKTIVNLLLIITGTVFMSGVSFGQVEADSKQPRIPLQTLESKLSQKALFIPKSKSALERLIEVARNYRIPMGLEWLEQSDGDDDSPFLNESYETVRQLIHAILAHSPAYQVRTEEGILYIAQPFVAASHKNFLNLRISRYEVKDVNLFDAEEQLRIRINLLLFPQLYKNGYGGGYGYPPDHVFTARNITASGSDLTIRSVLNKIAASSGNALWVVQLTPKELTSERSSWEQKRPDKYGHAKINSRWRFIPLIENDSDKV